MRLPTPNNDGSYASCNYRLLFKINSTYLCTVFKLILLRRQLHSVPLINWKSILTDFLIGYRICLLSISKWQVFSEICTLHSLRNYYLENSKISQKIQIDIGWVLFASTWEISLVLGEKNILECSLQNYSIFIAEKNNPKNRLCVCHRSHILFPCSNVMCVAYEFPLFVDINKSKSIELWMKLWQNKLIAADE